jgi:hypothetical protein
MSDASFVEHRGAITSRTATSFDAPPRVVREAGTESAIDLRDLARDVSRRLSEETAALERVAAAKAMLADFRKLTAEWRQAVVVLSSDDARMRHPACRRIVQLGREAVPLILAELERDAWHWGGVLAEITGEQPVAPDDAGRIERVAVAWLGWARDRGIDW